MRIRFLVCSLFVVASLAEAADAAVLLIDPGSSVTHDLTAEVDLEAVFLGVTSQDTLMDSTSVTSVANTGSGTVDMTWEPAISKLTISSLTFSVDTTGSLSDTGTLFALPVGLSYSAETISLTLQAPVEVTLAAAGAGVFTFPPTNLPLGVSATGTGQLSLAGLGVPAPLNMGGNVNPAASGTLVVNGSSGTLALSFIEPGPLDAPFSGSDSASGVDFSWNGVFRVTNVSASLQASGLIEPCGDGTVTLGETCDDSGTSSGDGCDASCQIEPGWTCSGEPSVCSEVCGDGIIAGGETCDDSGTSPGDGCDASCQIEPGWTCSGEPSVCSEVSVTIAYDLTAEVDLEAVFLGVTSQDTLMDSTSVTSVANTGSGTVDMTWEPAISKLTISSLTFSVDTTGSLSDTGTLFALPVGLSYSAETISLTLQAPVEVTLAAAGAGVFTFPPTNLPLGVSATGTGQLSLADLGVPAPLNMGGNVNPAASGTLVVNGSSGTLALSFIEPGPLDAPFSGSDSASGVDFSWNGVFRMTNVSASLQASDLIEPCGNGIVDPSETCDDSGTTPGDGCDATCQIEPGWSCSGAPSVCENVSVPALTPIALITLAALLLGAGAALVLGRPRFLG